MYSCTRNVTRRGKRNEADISERGSGSWKVLQEVRMLLARFRAMPEVLSMTAKQQNRPLLGAGWSYVYLAGYLIGFAAQWDRWMALSLYLIIGFSILVWRISYDY